MKIPRLKYKRGRAQFEVLPVAGAYALAAVRPHYWRLVAGNGEVLCHSQDYASIDAARAGARAARRAAATARIVERGR